MVPRVGRRAADREGWPFRDRVRFWVHRVARVLYVLVPILLAVYIAVTDGRNTDRDEARKYQRCTVTVSQVNGQNNTNRVLRSALLTSRNRMLLQVKRTADPVLRDRYRKNAAKYQADRDRIGLASIPDCRKTYPRGFEHQDDFPDLAPAAPPREARQ